MDEAALESAGRRLGWRIYRTNQPGEQRALAQAVLAYRSAYLVERSLGRLKGRPLSLTPMYGQRDDHATGLMRLLSIALTGLDAGGVRGAASVGGCRGDVSRSVCRECQTGNGSPDSRAVPRSVSRGDADGGEGGPPRVSPFDGSAVPCKSGFWSCWASLRECIPGFAPFLTNRFENGRNGRPGKLAIVEAGRVRLRS